METALKHGSWPFKVQGPMREARECRHYLIEKQFIQVPKHHGNWGVGNRILRWASNRKNPFGMAGSQAAVAERSAWWKTKLDNEEIGSVLLSTVATSLRGPRKFSVDKGDPPGRGINPASLDDFLMENDNCLVLAKHPYLRLLPSASATVSLYGTPWMTSLL